MNRSRRQLLKTGAIVEALSGVLPGEASGDSAEPQAQKDQMKWGRGSNPGQTLPPEAANGPWRNLRAVKEKKVIDFHTHTYETPKQGTNYKEEGQMHERDQ